MMKRYVVIVKENKEEYHFMSEKKAKKFMFDYAHGCLNQDFSWCPHFEVREEVLEKGD